MAAQFLTPSELAQHWRCSASKIRRMCAGGELPGALKLGTDWRIPSGAVEIFETASSEPAESPAPTREQPAVVAAPLDFELPPGYEPRFPTLWGMTREEAAQLAAGRGRSTGKRKTASVRT